MGYGNVEFLLARQISPLMKKMITQLLLSLSIFSFLFSYSSFISSSLTTYLSSCPKSSDLYFPTDFLNKNCLFLICNGLLVFLSKTSGLVCPPDFNGDMMIVQTKEQHPLHVMDNESGENEDDEYKKEDKKSSSENRRPQDDEQVSIFIAESSEEEEREWCRSCWLLDDHEQLYEDEEGEEKEELMSAQELNQKFEDFIKKMKEDIY